MNAVTVKNLTKKFKEATVLNNINVEFEAGKVHGLIGRNGSGKTMLMKCICGIVPYKTGEIRVNDKIIGKDVDIPQNVGVIIETPGFLPNYSAYNNLKSQGKTILIASHSAEDIDVLCDTVCEMDKGKLAKIR